ncbi:MAG: TolC family protein [bacterium]|nr:TolC family protein [bacterium]
MKNKLPLFLVLFFFGLNQILAQTEINMSYKDFLENVKRNNPIARTANNFGEIGRIQYQAARGNYDPVLSGSAESKFYRSTSYYDVIEAGIKQPIFTSQYLKMGYEYGSGNYVNPEQATSSFGLPYVGLEVSLLQGMVIDKRRAEVLKSRSYVNYYQSEQNIILNNLLFESARFYFDWLFAEKQFALHSHFYNLAKFRLYGIEALAVSGERPTVDTIEAVIYMQSRMLDQQSAAIEKSKKLNELLNLNWKNDFSPLDSSSNFIVTDSLDLYYSKSRNLLLVLMLQDSLNNPIIDQYKAKQGVLEVDQRLKREMIKPRLDVSYNFLSNNANSYSPVFSTNSYKWGANLSFPLLMRNARNEYKLATLNVKNNQNELNAKRNEITMKHRFYRQSVSVLLNQLENAERAVMYSKLLLEAERLKFDNGESSLFMLNTREGKLLESELKLAEYKLKFLQLHLSFIHLNGSQNYIF